MVFRADCRFMRKYGARLGLAYSGNLEWESQDDAAIWLDAVVHDSLSTTTLLV